VNRFLRSALALLAFSAWALAANAAAIDNSPRQSDGLNVMDYIPRNLRAAVRASTSTADVTSYFQGALQAACDAATAGNDPPKVFCPYGRYNVSALTMPCSNLTLEGPAVRQGYSCNIYATGNIRGGATQGALIYTFGQSRMVFKNLRISGNDFDGDLIHISKSTYSVIDGCFFDNNDRARWDDASGSASANTITSDGSGSYIVNNMRVGFWVHPGTGTLPSPLAMDTAYRLCNKSGTTFKVSTDLTSCTTTVDLTTSGSGSWGWISGSWKVASIDSATDIITAPLHGFLEGQRVVFDQNTNGIGRRTSFFVRNPTTDTFQVSYQNSTGAVFDLTGATATPHVTHSTAGIRGGANLYLHVTNNYFQDLDNSILMSLGESPVTSGEYYGCNSCNYNDNIVFTNGTLLDGEWRIGGNNFEAAAGPGTDAMLRVGGSAVHAPWISGNYFEISDGPSPQYGIATGGLSGNTSVGTIVGNVLYGPAAAASDSICIAPGVNATQMPKVIGNSCGSFYYFIGGPTSWGGGESREVNLTTNSYSNCTVSGYPTSGAVDIANSQRDHFTHDPFKGYEFGGAVHYEVRTATDPTTLDLSLGSFFDLTATAGSTIASVTNSYVGGQYWLRSSGAARTTLPSSVFGTLSGTDRKMLAGEVLPIWVDPTGKPTLILPMGAVTGSVEPAGSNFTASVGTTNIFSGNVTAGTYKVHAYVWNATAAAAGTVDFIIGWTDAVGATTKTVVSALSLSGTGRDQGDVVVRTNGSSNITYAATVAGLTGTPGFNFSVGVERLQ
jgi:hypothetical protein